MYIINPSTFVHIYSQIHSTVLGTEQNKDKSKQTPHSRGPAERKNSKEIIFFRSVPHWFQNSGKELGESVLQIR